tara:strand:+ start:606 stop:1175 length:570 start_codon:yes stop_codon:yes gene_type:complete
LNSILKINNLNKIDKKNKVFFKDFDVKYKPSSVLILIFLSNGSEEILFLKRSDDLVLHKGEICFPGGSYEYFDQDLLNTAYREVEEEAGIKRDNINVLSSLDDEITRTGFIIKPFVGIINKKVKIKIDNKEIVEYFKLPIKVLKDNKNIRYFYFAGKNNKLEKKVSFSIDGRIIWGATANILNQFLNKV